jgi:hypothetical protein
VLTDLSADPVAPKDFPRRQTMPHFLAFQDGRGHCRCRPAPTSWEVARLLSMTGSRISPQLMQRQPLNVMKVSPKSSKTSETMTPWHRGQFMGFVSKVNCACMW